MGRVTSPAPSLDFFGDSADDGAEDKKSAIAAAKKKHNMRSQAKRQLEEDMEEFRRRVRVKVSGEDVPSPWASWNDLSSAMRSTGCTHRSIKAMRSNLEASSWREPTAVQMQAGPTIVAGRDTLVSAPTGSGKTGAFVVPLVVALLVDSSAGAMILAPTRELCAQLAREVKKLVQGTGVCERLAVTTASKAAATVASKGTDWLWAIADEADRLLATTSAELAAVDAVFSRSKRKALFSATVPPSLEELADTTLLSPIRIRVLGSGGTAAPDSLDQKLVFVAREANKLNALRDLIRSGQAKPPALVFVQTASRASQLATALAFDGLRSAALSRCASRSSILDGFRTGRIWFLVATDLASRGLDLKAVNAVINYDAPASAVDYLHRVGRCARAGRPGRAFTLYTDADAHDNMRSIANLAHLADNPVPDWLRNLKRRRKRQTVPKAKRGRIAPPPQFLVKKLRKKRAAVSSERRPEQEEQCK